MKYKLGWYLPGTIIVASDRKYIVDSQGCWRVYEYTEGYSQWKKLRSMMRGLLESN
jgi:hypothetical protein